MGSPVDLAEERIGAEAIATETTKAENQKGKPAGEKRTGYPRAVTTTKGAKTDTGTPDRRGRTEQHLKQ